MIQLMYSHPSYVKIDFREHEIIIRPEYQNYCVLLPNKVLVHLGVLERVLRDSGIEMEKQMFGEILFLSEKQKMQNVLSHINPGINLSYSPCVDQGVLNVETKLLEAEAKILEFMKTTKLAFGADF